MKVALVYDRVNKWGGAERVLLMFHEMFPDAPLYTSVYNPKSAKWASVFPKVYTSFLQKLPLARIHHEWFAVFMPLAFESFDFSGYDLVISVTSEFAKSIITKPETKHICYCLTPTRYLWSGYDEYFEKPWLRYFARPVVGYLRKIDKIAGQRPDEMVAISTEVQKRIKKYYGVDAKIIFPSINTFRSHRKNSLLRGPSAASRSLSLDVNYFLIVSRLVTYKKVDLAVQAFNKNCLPLVIVGVGSEEKRLKKMANKNIKFMGQVTEKELAMYYKNCKALIFPQEEDFGLVAVEALSFGKPVIAYKKGGALDVINEGENGIFFGKQSEASLEKAVKRFAKVKWNNDIIVFTSRRFDIKKWQAHIKTICML